MRHKQRQTRAQQGGVLVESLIGISGLVLMFACLCLAHQYATAEILALQRARNQAWYRSLHDCSSTEPVVKDLAQDVMNGSVPVPDGFLPSDTSGSTSFSVPGMFGRAPLSGSRNVTFMCNPEPSRGDPLREPAEWVIGLFL